MGELGIFISFQVTHVFQGELYKMKVIYLKCFKVLTKLWLLMFRLVNVTVQFLVTEMTHLYLQVLCHALNILYLCHEKTNPS